MLFARIPLTILAGLALVNGHQLAKRQGKSLLRPSPQEEDSRDVQP